MRKKVFVEVTAVFDTEGNVTPKSIKWNDGDVYEIDKVLETRRAASLKVGGQGIRYLCRINSQQTYLFYEDPNWFVEAKENN